MFVDICYLTVSSRTQQVEFSNEGCKPSNILKVQLEHTSTNQMSTLELYVAELSPHWGSFGSVLFSQGQIG